MKRKFSLLMVTFLLLVFVTGCSNSVETKTDDNSTEVVLDDTSQESEDKEDEVSQEADQSQENQTDNANEEDILTVEETTYPFTYTDSEGREIVMEKQPEKIAISYLPHWEYLIALETMPIATTYARQYEETMDAIKDYDLSSVVDLGDSEINLELLTELEPDLILNQMYDSGVENLEKIAPVAVLDERVKMDWRFGLREIGKIIGKAQLAEEKISEIDKILSDAKVKLDVEYKDQTVMLMSLMGKDRYFYAYRADLFDDETGLGLNTPEGYTQSTSYEQVSLEALVELDPDYLFIALFDGNEGLYEELSENSVWNTLTAVKENHVYVLDGSAHACSVLSTVYTINSIVDNLLN